MAEICVGGKPADRRNFAMMKAGNINHNLEDVPGLHRAGTCYDGSHNS